MKSFFKKIGLHVLDLFRPLFQYFVRKYSYFFRDLRASFDDPYLCAMVTRFNLLHEWIFRPNFEKVRVDEAEINKLKGLSSTGTLVYVMKNSGQLEYSYFNHRFLKDGIPLARFANGCRTLYWRPLKQIIRSLVARLDYYYEKGLLDDPIQSGYLQNLVTRGESALLNLKVSRELIFGVMEDPVEFIPPLLLAAKKSAKPVYLITQQFIYDRHPDKAKKSWVDLMFGEKSNPGMFRKLILFAMSYRKRATVKFGEAMDLKKFIEENPKDDLVTLAHKLMNVLLGRLMIERKSITGPALQSRDRLLDKILRNKTFKDELDVIRQELRLERPEVESRAAEMFHEIAAEVNYTYVDLYDHLVRWILNNVFDGLDLDTAGLSKVKAIAGKNPIVLVPTHKSHLDYLLLSYIFYNYDLTLPHICAGINLKFWPVEGFIRRAGGFFIRRSLGGEKLYKLVLEHYLKVLVREGYSVEFFIEGTRSRTGKLLKPKMGILSMLIETYLDGTAPDVYFVPIAINYERILEEKSYISEIHGASKQKESAKSLLSARKSFGKKYGKVFVKFSDPLSLKEFMDERGHKPLETGLDACRADVEEFAYRITYNINRVSTVTSTSLTSMAVLSSPARGLPEREVLRRIQSLKRYLLFKGASLSDVAKKEGMGSYLEVLNKMASDKTVQVYEDFQERFYTIDSGRRPILDYHKNNSIHFFVSLTCLSKILDVSSGGSLTLGEIRKKYETLKTLLQHDFTFSQRASLNEHLMRVIDFYVQEGLVDYDESTEIVRFERLKGHPDFRLYATLLDNFFESHYLTLLYLKYVSFTKSDPKKLEKAILEKGHALFLKGDLKHAEAVSRFNIASALVAFQDLGLIKKEGKDSLSRTYDEESVQRWEDILRQLLHVEVSREQEMQMQQAFQAVTEEVGKESRDLH